MERDPPYFRTCGRVDIEHVLAEARNEESNEGFRDVTIIWTMMKIVSRRSLSV
jgi:hypothetical protein